MKGKKNMKALQKKSKYYTETFKIEINDIFENPKKFKKWITTSLKFRNYSIFNRMLISLQDPDASYVATYKQWQDLGFKVVSKGGIRLARPNYIKGFYRDKDFISLKNATEQEKKDISAGLLKTHQIMKGFSYFTVFDISKTNATEQDLTKIISNQFHPTSNIITTLSLAYNFEPNPQDSPISQIRQMLDIRISQLLSDTEIPPKQQTVISDGIVFALLSLFGEDATSIKMSSLKDADIISNDSKKFTKAMSSTLESVLDDIVPYC